MATIYDVCLLKVVENLVVSELKRMVSKLDCRADFITCLMVP